MKTAACLVLLSAVACSTELTFQAPQTWEERYAELATEYGLPDSFPDPGQRPEQFSCSIWSPVGCLLVQGSDPELTTLHVLSVDGVWSAGVTLPMPDNGVLSVDLTDGTDVYIIENLVIFDGAYTELDNCTVPDALPPEPAYCKVED